MKLILLILLAFIAGLLYCTWITPPMIVENKPIASYADAVASSKQTSKPLFVYFGATWCGPCQRMHADTLGNAAVKEKLAGYTVWIADTDKEPELSNKFKVNAVPTYFVLDDKQQPKQQGTGYRDANAFIRWLDGR